MTGLDADHFTRLNLGKNEGNINDKHSLAYICVLEVVVCKQNTKKTLFEP